jgi:hypothetical protein
MRRTTWSGLFGGGLSISVLLVLTLGCGSLAERLKSASNTTSNTAQSNRGTGTSPWEPKKPAEGERLFEDAQQLHDFTSALTAAVGSENPNVLKLSFYDQYAMVELQDPKKPENIDGYTWRGGKLSLPNPVKILGNGKISDNVFPLKDVNINGLPDLTKEIMEKLKDVEGGHLTGYVVSRGLPFSKDIRILGLTDATRKSISSEADKNAKLKKFEVR